MYFVLALMLKRDDEKLLLRHVFGLL